MTVCHSPTHIRPGQPAAYDLTWRTAPLTGRHAGPGLTLTESVCSSCRDARATQIEAAGGRITSLHALPAPAAPIAPAPVGLDAITPVLQEV